MNSFEVERLQRLRRRETKILLGIFKNNVTDSKYLCSMCNSVVINSEEINFIPSYILPVKNFHEVGVRSKKQQRETI